MQDARRAARPRTDLEFISLRRGSILDPLLTTPFVLSLFFADEASTTSSEKKIVAPTIRVTGSENVCAHDTKDATSSASSFEREKKGGERKIRSFFFFLFT